MPSRTSPTFLIVPREPRAAPQPRLRRHLPQLVTDILQSGREAGRPYHYTTRDVRAIVQYVSEAPRVTPGAFTPTNWDEVDACQARHRSSVQRFAAEQRAQQQCRSLKQRLAGPSLASRIAAAEASATYTPIALTPAPGAFDFERLKVPDLLKIVGTKLKATRTRLAVLDNIPVPESANREHCAAVDRLRARLLLLHTTKLEELAPTLSHAQWTRLNWCLKSIGDISFARVRSRYARILAELAAVSNVGHLVWVPIPAELSLAPA